MCIFSKYLHCMIMHFLYYFENVAKLKLSLWKSESAMLESTFKIGIPAVWNIENSSFVTQFITLVFVHNFCFLF